MEPRLLLVALAFASLVVIGTIQFTQASQVMVPPRAETTTKTVEILLHK